ncbi:MAG: 50S ribosomal protein L3 [Coriobacteriales bacterium]|jgi:large subunit ribosomal protein L3|nr:50S ribosomal protein L3 [Coriobacteriales bacterium]
MCKTIIGKKIGMTQVWGEGDKLTPVTVIEAGPCPIVQIKTAEKDGYNALQIGFGAKKEKQVNKPTAGHFKASKVDPTRILEEVRLDDVSDYKLGDQITVEALAETKEVNVSGVSKGKGFAGVMRRYNFGGGPGGHGHHFHRAPGSVGMCATPSRVLKGLRLPGHMGCDNVTVRNLEVVRVEPEQNLILVKGAVPGGKNALVTITATA